MKILRKTDCLVSSLFMQQVISRKVLHHEAIWYDLNKKQFKISDLVSMLGRNFRRNFSHRWIMCERCHDSTCGETAQECSIRSETSCSSEILRLEQSLPLHVTFCSLILLPFVVLNSLLFNLTPCYSSPNPISPLARHCQSMVYYYKRLSNILQGVHPASVPCIYFVLMNI